MRRPSRRVAVLLAAVAASALLGGGMTQAVPLYTARAGRACDNCHTDPSGWKNPRLARRKCNLSCATCHVNPSGGGLRTVAGRFFGQATLPMLAASHRPYQDWKRHVWRRMKSRQRKNRVPEPAVGRTPGGSAPMAYDQQRYAGLKADPLLWAGIDGRIAMWFPGQGAGAMVFPMQLDVHLALHPYRYLTAYASGGVLSKSQGYASTFAVGCRPAEPGADCYSRAHSTPFMVKDTFLMLHQLPYMAYARVGRFLPPFGQLMPDHTIPTRRQFELDHGLLHSRVSGVELGLAPNYPYLQLALFRPNRADRFTDDPDATSPDELPPFFGVDGWGAAINVGVRELGWQLGVSGMLRRRELHDGGDTESLALSAGFNPWYYLPWLPLTYLVELAVGLRQRPGSGRSTSQLALVQELHYLPFNGVNVRLRHDYADFDLELADDQINRLALGSDITVLPGFGISGELRASFFGGTPGSDAVDGLIYFRGWY